MQGSKKPPTSEVVEASKADRRSERNTRPPSPMPIRRDDRAEPDDDDVGSSRIDVVNVDGGGGSRDGGGGSRDNSAAASMVNLRRELAKLHQQAALVEKSLEEQRRDRTDSLDRLERATERAVQLESRLSTVESEAASLRTQHEGTLAELASVRAERDDLARAVESAKSATAELGRLRDEVERLRATASEAARTGAELSKAREEIARVVAEANKAKSDAEKAREAIKIAEGDAALVGDQASKIREEAAKIRAEADQARDDLKSARDEVSKARGEATTAKVEADKVRQELATARSATTSAREDVAKVTEDLRKTREDLARAKEDNQRDRATARDRIDLLERALEDARATSLRTEADLEKARASEERTARQLEAALSAAAEAESRAMATATAHAALENSLRRLRDEITGAFARVGHAPPPPLPTAKQQIYSLPPDMVESLPPDSFPAEASASTAPLPLDVKGPPPLPRSFPPDETAIPESAASSSPASKSVPPPRSSVAPPPAQASIPPPTYASVPPQVHDSVAPALSWSPPASPSAPPPAPPPAPLPSSRPSASAPPASPSPSPSSVAGTPLSPPALALRVATVPPPPMEDSVHPGSRKTTPPPPAPRGSMPPRLEASDDALPPSADWRESAPPPTRRPSSAVPPPADLDSPTRELLLAKLVDPDAVEEAVALLRQHPEWLRSMPPPTFLAALASVDYNADASVFELARAWDREPLCHALIASLRSDADVRIREHAAWLLKHLAAPSSWKAIADLARSDEEPSQLRRWLLEAIDRLAAGRAIGWRELGDLVTTMAHHEDASLRDGVVGILVSLERSDEKRRLLMDILRTDDDEVVLASAVNALASVLPMELDPVVAERLLGHPSPRVQRSVKELIERMRQSK